MRYSTIPNWAKYFEEAEGVQICDVTIRKKLSEAGKIGKTGRNKVGKILKDAYFSESDVRDACIDLLQQIPQADDDGSFIKDGQKYGTISYFERTLGISQKAILSRLNFNDLIAIKGRTKAGRVCEFYQETVIRGACFDLLRSVPHSDADGFFEKSGERFSTIAGWSKKLGICKRTMILRLKKTPKESVKGKDAYGHVCDFYQEATIQELIRDLIQKIPQADEYGFFEKDGNKYGTIKAWSKVFGISQCAIIPRAKKNNLQSVKGKDSGGNARDFYTEAIMLQICADLLNDLPQADEKGFFVRSQQKYGTKDAWPKMLGISASTISSRIKTHKPQSVKGKRRGRIFDFYPESAIREICADLLLARQSSSEGGKKK